MSAQYIKYSSWFVLNIEYLTKLIQSRTVNMMHRNQVYWQKSKSPNLYGQSLKMRDPGNNMLL